MSMWPKDMRGKPMRDQLGEAIHRFADRISPATARRLTGMSFTYERGEGHSVSEGSTGVSDRLPE